MSGLNISFGLTASEDELAAWKDGQGKVAELVDAELLISKKFENPELNG